MIEIFSLSKKHHQKLMFYQLESASTSVMEFSTPQKKNSCVDSERLQEENYKHLHTFCKTGMKEQIIPQDNLSGRVVGC